MIMNIILLIAMAAAIATAEDYSPEEVQELNLKKLAYANNYLGLNLHKVMIEECEENVFFSPFTVSSVLSILYIGARGETAEVSY